jgi:hypothetical protein
MNEYPGQDKNPLSFLFFISLLVVKFLIAFPEGKIPKMNRRTKSNKFEFKIKSGQPPYRAGSRKNSE